MPLVINSNISSLNSQRQLVKSGAELDQAMERLSSGKKINTAADDAAGLAISNRQTSTILGLNRAVENANDGVSLVQTAEGALDETTNILQRMRELSIQSANGIYSDTDRATLDAEVQQLKAEVDRIAETTSFNGQNILDGSLGDVALQVGSNANQTIDFTVDGFNASSLGGSGGDLIGEATAGGLASLTAFDAAGTTTTLQVNDVDISALSGATTLNEALDIINSDLDGKGAEASALVSYETDDVGDGQLIAGTDEFILTVTDGDGLTQVYEITDTKNLQELADKINSDTAITASISTDTGKLVLSQENVVSIVGTGVGGGAAAAGIGGAEEDNFRLSFNDTSSDGAGVKVETAAVAATNGLSIALGVDFQTDEGNIRGEVLTDAGTAALNEGDLVINGVEIGAVTDGATAGLQVSNVIEAINAKSSETGVVAYAAGTGNEAIELSSTKDGQISVAYGIGTTAATIQDATGLQRRNDAAGAGSVSGVDISTQAGAQAAIDVIDVALEQINTQRSELGAISNRLDFTVSNLMNVSENTASARSRIVDADFASETANLSRAQVLQQASTAMLAQANAAPSQVLSLLQ